MSVDRHLHQMCFVHMIFYTEMATKGNQGSSDICVCVCVCVCVCCVVLWCCARVVYVSTYILIPVLCILVCYCTIQHFTVEPQPASSE